MSKVAVLIDGLNFYHSVIRVEEETGFNAKWFDFRSICNTFMRSFSKNSQLTEIIYFTTEPTHYKKKDPTKILRFNLYINLLKSLGIKVELGRFREKDVICKNCHSKFIKHEEKETDVAIAVKMLELFCNNSCDTEIIISGDTDLVPAVKCCQRLFNSNTIIFAFPFKNKSHHLKALCPKSINLKLKHYKNHLLPNPLILPYGTIINKPRVW